MMGAALQGHATTVQILLSAGADATLTSTSGGKTALDFVILRGHPAVVEMLGGGVEAMAAAQQKKEALDAAAALPPSSSSSPSSGGKVRQMRVAVHKQWLATRKFVEAQPTQVKFKLASGLLLLFFLTFLAIPACLRRQRGARKQRKAEEAAEAHAEAEAEERLGLGKQKKEGGKGKGEGEGEEQKKKKK